MNFFFCMLLDSEGMNADLTIVGGIEALNVAYNLFSLLGREILECGVIGEGEIGTFPSFELAEELEDLALLIAFLQFAAFGAVVGAVEGVGFEAGLVNELPELGRAAMDEFGSKLQDLIAFAEGANAAADAISCLEHQDLPTGFGQTPGSSEAGHAGTDDQNTLLS